MTVEDFRSLEEHDAAGHTPLLHALWLEAHDDWGGAHTLAQDIETQEGAWVHAYLHRKEGDEFNAAYWYRRAGKAVCKDTFQEEWRTLVAALLKHLSKEI